MKSEYRRKGFDYSGTSLVEQREPDIQGEGGAMWRLVIIPPESRPEPVQHAMVGIWLLHAPHAHPLWEYYAVILMHLREIEGVPSPEKGTQLMEYQVNVFTLNPQAPLPLMAELERGVTTERRLSILHPSDFESQFQQVGGDHIAHEIVDELCRYVAQGKLSPDSDYRSQWALHLASKVMIVLEDNSSREVH